MALFKTEGVVVRTRNLGEADRIITLYTPNRGKLDGVARGARRTRSRLMGGTQLFTHGTYMIFPGRSLDTISQAAIVNSFSGLREDLTKMAYSSYVAELIDVFVMPGEPSEPLFRLLLESFSALDEIDEAELVLRRFELGLMALLGYQPQLDACLSCGAHPGETLRFSIREGGILCPSCHGTDAATLPVTPGTVQWMKRLPTVATTRLGVFRLAPDEMKHLESICRAYVDYRLSRPLKSVSFMSSIRDLA